jgi:hypothetical protein
MSIGNADVKKQMNLKTLLNHAVMEFDIWFLMINGGFFLSKAFTKTEDNPNVLERCNIG